MAHPEPVSTQARGRGRPAIGARRQVVLDDQTVATLTALGGGNLSAGIREAARLIDQQQRPSPSR
jgi:hypothetical protein